MHLIVRQADVCQRHPKYLGEDLDDFSQGRFEVGDARHAPADLVDGRQFGHTLAQARVERGQFGRTLRHTLFERFAITGELGFNGPARADVLEGGDDGGDLALAIAQRHRP